MEWQGDGMQCQWNRMERNGMAWNRLFKIDARSAKKEARGFQNLNVEARRFEADVVWLGMILANTQFFLTFQLNQHGRDRWRTGETSPRQHAKKTAKVSKNRPQSLQNRALEPPKLNLEPSTILFLKDLSLKKAQEGLARSFGEPK